jgi:hypothetical protein
MPAVAAVSFSLALLTACTAPLERAEPLPAALAADARIPDIPGARYWGDLRPAQLDAWLSMPEAALRERYGGIMGRRHDYLVISGGGSNGAYGAGLLTGWTDEAPASADHEPLHRHAHRDAERRQPGGDLHHGA